MIIKDGFVHLDNHGEPTSVTVSIPQWTWPNTVYPVSFAFFYNEPASTDVDTVLADVTPEQARELAKWVKTNLKLDVSIRDCEFFLGACKKHTQEMRKRK